MLPLTIHADSPRGVPFGRAFSRMRTIAAFFVESAALAPVGGAIGCTLGRSASGLSTGAALVFSASMGAVGGLLPALRAARIPVAHALREI